MPERIDLAASPSLHGTGRAPAALVGLGAVTPAGQGVDKFWNALFRAPGAPTRHAIGGLPDGAGSLRHGYTVSLPAQASAALSRFEQMAVSAIVEALADAQGRGLQLHEATIGLAIGTAAGATEEAEAERLAGRAPQFAACNPYRIVDRLPEHLDLFILRGPVFAVSNACAAGLYALAHAVDLIADGSVDAMLVVGVETLSRVTQAGFQKMTALDPDRCRPFDAQRRGTVLGEGAAALLLVSPKFAEGRTQQAYCQVTSTGTSCDAHHPTAPRPDGRDIRAAVSRALDGAGLRADDVSLVVPHGTGTTLNDHIESDMLHAVFGDAVSDLQVMPIKSHLGHGAGASGAFSVLAAALALAASEVPPALHIETTDAQLALRFRREASTLPDTAHRRALVNAYGFGGSNISVVLERSSHG